MGIISKEVEVLLAGINIKYYENLGYEIPRVKKYGRYSVPKDTKITVNVFDLPPQSHADILVECDNCYKNYTMKYYDYTKINHDGKIYCHDCSQTIFISGEKNPNYKKSKTDEERQQGRMYNGYHRFIREVLKRDNYTCRRCGESKTCIDVHHLDGYDWCIEKRTDTDNGISLCEKCHSNFHSIYGKGSNTKEQFEEWIGCPVIDLKINKDIEHNIKKVYCIEEDKIYDSVRHLYTEWDVLKSAVYNICNHKITYSKGKKTLQKKIKGKHILWYDEYLSMSKEELDTYIRTSYNMEKWIKVRCIDTGIIYYSLREAERKTGCFHTSIKKCCDNMQKYVTDRNNNKLHWEYYEEIKTD